MNKLIVPALITAVVVFIWMFISWAVIGWHYADVKNLPNGDAIVEQMKASMNEPGIYIYPGQPESGSETEMDELTRKYKAGPLVNFMVYNPAGANPMDPMQFVKSFIINFIAAFIAGILLMMTLAQNPSYWRRVIFVMMLGLFAAFVGPFVEWNWWGFPLGYTLVNVADYCITWFFAGLVLAWRIKPEVSTKAA
jgi:VIT1/CCC1 family predicted Fe2+/Mn2+ transporter